MDAYPPQTVREAEQRPLPLGLDLRPTLVLGALKRAMYTLSHGPLWLAVLVGLDLLGHFAPLTIYLDRPHAGLTASSLPLKVGTNHLCVSIQNPSR